METEIFAPAEMPDPDPEDDMIALQRCKHCGEVRRDFDFGPEDSDVG